MRERQREAHAVETDEGRALRRMAAAMHGEHSAVAAATGKRPHASRPSWAGAVNRGADDMAQQLVEWLREKGYVDSNLPPADVLDLAKKAFLAAVVWRDGTRTRGVPQEHLNAVVGYELHERGICAAQRKVARAQHRSKTYEEEIEEEWELEACRCPRTTAGLDVLRRRAVGAFAGREVPVPGAS